MANATNRFTGVNSQITWSGTIVSNDYTELDIELTMKTEDRTAGSEQDASYNTTIREGKATLKVFDLGNNGTAIQALFKPGTTGNLQVLTKGVTTGLPKLTFPAIVTGVKESVIFDKNLMFEVSFIKNGAMVDDLGAVQ